MRRSLVFVLLLSLPLAAEELWVANQPYQGALNRTGGEIRVELEPFLKCLSLQFQAGDTGGCIAPEDAEVCSTDHQGVFYRGRRLNSAKMTPSGYGVQLKELAQVLEGRVIHNRELGTIDFYRAPQSCARTAKLRVLSFVNAEDVEGAVRRMEGFSKSQEADLVVMDAQARDTAAFETYGSYLRLGSIPYTVLVDASGRVMKSWDGLPTTGELTQAQSSYKSQVRQRQAQARSSNRTAKRRTTRRFIRRGGG